MKKPDWYPKNPYFESVFPATVEDYIREVPDPQTRTALSGALGRLFWELASDAILTAINENLQDIILNEGVNIDLYQQYERDSCGASSYIEWLEGHVTNLRKRLTDLGDELEVTRLCCK
jgi:hypothetical protein